MAPITLTITEDTAADLVADLNNPTATIDVTGSTYKGTAGPPTITGFATVTGTITPAVAA
jgi:hypothetical protein